MSIFEPEEEKREIAFDEESKIRLFETQQRESAEVHDYVKKFLPVAIVAVILVGLAIYLMQPGVGDVVAVQTEMKQAVYDYMLTKEKRTVSEMTFYQCDGYTWVKVLAEPRAYPPSLIEDAVNQYRLRVERAGEKLFNVTTLPLPAKENDKPCAAN